MRSADKLAEIAVLWRAMIRFAVQINYNQRSNRAKFPLLSRLPASTEDLIVDCLTYKYGEPWKQSDLGDDNPMFDSDAVSMGRPAMVSFQSY